MRQLALTYEQWMQVHPSCRSIIGGVLHVAVYDDGGFTLMRVAVSRPPVEPERLARPGDGQLPLRAA